MMEIEEIRRDEAADQLMKDVGMDFASQAKRAAARLTPSTNPMGPVETPTIADELLQRAAARREVEEAERSKLEEARANAPGRNIPIVGDIQRGLDWVADKTKPAADIAQELYTPRVMALMAQD